VTGRHRGPRSAPIATLWTAALALLAVATLSAAIVTASRPVTIGGRAAVGTVGGSIAEPAPESDPGRLATAAEPPPVMPVRLRIDKLGLVTDVQRVDLDASGALQAPNSPQVAGWFAGGPVPGDAGPALVAGFVDTARGPAVFFRLATLQLGDRIIVERSDGRTAVFAVVSVRMFTRDRLPTVETHSPDGWAQDVPELRLVTYGGPVGRLGGRDLDNVIVEAVAAP